ncbi:tellurite resistance TerB family protein [Agrobacterium rosae]|uniref:tellurite resistance TerB family protein n=1 Tax=Agrobacterium rosae TaxID=1972867 RepID=UPI00122ECBB1|nr:tellurite resistance TerB family protein [Agrobacterium rosae]KAA3512980.1 tellurite resistance TerB family protein [Agrobacterium rosae]KAA3521534.1 tellurite resistance TerB family protein [Agrobacterium rosae]MQB48453.1 tellurite resistance TerB family protein [Agrobacterium rosae]
MFDAKKLLDQFLGSNVPGLSGSVRDRAGQATQIAKNNPMKAGAIAAAIFGTKTGRKLAGNAAAVGGIAAIAGLGYLAYKNYQSGQKPEAVQQPQPTQALLPPPVDSPFHPQSETLSNNFALTLVQAMIAAAKADGHIGEAERARIMEKVQVSELDSEAGAFIEKELADPLDINALVAAAKTEEQKVELYTASRLTIEPDSRAERGYLDLLAGRLGLPDALVEHIEATVSAAKV